MSHLFAPFRSLAGYREFRDGAVFKACCPVHTEKTPSFRGVMRGTKLLLCCDGCHAKAPEILRAMGLTWASLFTDSPAPPAEVARLQIEQQKRREEFARFDAWRISQYCAIADDLNDRDAILVLDWSDYAGEETDALLCRLVKDYAYREYRFEFLRYGDRADVMREWNID